MTFETHSPEQTEALGEALGKVLRPGAVVAYTGDLGQEKPPSPGVWPRDWGHPSR